MCLLSQSEASIQKKTSTAKFARSLCTDPTGALPFRGKITWLGDYLLATRDEEIDELLDVFLRLHDD